MFRVPLTANYGGLALGLATARFGLNFKSAVSLTQTIKYF